jgi:hypothetical protein
MQVRPDAPKMPGASEPHTATFLIRISRAIGGLSFAEVADFTICSHPGSHERSAACRTALLP